MTIHQPPPERPASHVVRISELLRAQQRGEPERFAAVEGAYRHGYHDGWVTALDALYERIPHHGRDGAFSVCFAFWMRDLLAWAREAPLHFRFPPRLE